MTKGELITTLRYAEGSDDTPVRVQIKDFMGKITYVEIDSISWFSDAVRLNIDIAKDERWIVK